MFTHNDIGDRPFIIMSSSTGQKIPSPSPLPSNPSDESSGHEVGRRKKNFKKKKHFPQRGSGFEGKCEAIKQHVYDVVPGKNGFDVFAKTTTEIGEYIASNVPNAGEFTLVMRPENLGFPTIAAPDDPADPTNLVQVERWKAANKRYDKLIEQREENQKRAYAIVWGQCSPTIQDRVKANDGYLAINTNLDLIGLLGLIRTSMYTGATSKDKIHSLIDAMDKFHSFKQTSRMDNATYLRTFQSHIEAIDHLRGDFGVHHTLIIDRMIEDNEDTDDLDVYMEKRDEIREEVVAKYFLTKSDPKRYASLIASIQNDFISGQDKYPKTLNKAYDLLVNYVNPNKPTGIDGQDYGMSFLLGDDDGRPGRGGGRNAGRSGRGGRGRYSNRGRGRGGAGRHHDRSNEGESDDDGDEQNFELEQEEQIGGGPGNNSNDTSRGYSSFYNSRPTNQHSTGNNDDRDECIPFNLCAAEQFVLQQQQHTLPNRWLLLDSCSTIDIVANPQVLHDVYPADAPTWVRCNAGRVKLTHQEYLGDYPCPVWYNPKGIANILSLNNLSKTYCVTMDTSRSMAMIVHKQDGSTITFTPSISGLYKYELETDDSIRDMWSFLSTVKDKASSYTRREYKCAMLARKLQNITMRSDSRKLCEAIIPQLLGCPVTEADVRAADDIFGHNIGSLKGKTVRRANAHVEAEIDALPIEVIRMANNVVITIDIMFINKIPFFITLSRHIKFGTIEAIPN